MLVVKLMLYGHTLSGEYVFSPLRERAFLEAGDSLLSPCSRPAPDAELRGHVVGSHSWLQGTAWSQPWACPAPWRVAARWPGHVPRGPVLPGDAGGAVWEVTPVVYHVPALGLSLVLSLLPERVLLTPALLSGIPLRLGSPAHVVLQLLTHKPFPSPLWTE